MFSRTLKSSLGSFLKPIKTQVFGSLSHFNEINLSNSLIMKTLIIPFRLNALKNKLFETLMINIRTDILTNSEHILEVNTFRRKRTKLKKAKRKQRRKKIRRLSVAKKKRLNF